MNDMEERNQEVWSGKIKEPPEDQEFAQVSRCLECGGEVVSHSIGNEGIGRCDDCETVEGNSITVYVCSLCEEDCEEEECDCYQR